MGWAFGCKPVRVNSKVNVTGKSTSINRTLQTAVVSFALILAVCLVGLLIAYAYVVEDNVFNRLVNSEAGYLEQVYEEQGRVAQPRFPFMTVYASWQELPVSVQELHVRSLERVEFPTETGGTLHVQALQLDGNEWILAADVTGFEVSRDYLPRLVPWIGLIFVIVLGAAWLLSFYLGRSITQPLARLSNSFKQSSDTAAPLELPPHLPSNEIGYLAEVVKSSVDKLQAALQREADFTRDISHELRTPITVLRFLVERLDDTKGLSEQQGKQLTEMVARIEETTTVLLALAREESVQTESLGLLAELEACIVSHRKLSGLKDFELTINVPDSYRIHANQNLLQLILTNLINNALEHASEPMLHIELKDHALHWTNPVGNQTPENVIETSVKGPASQGLGQGLHLVKRICQLRQWRLETVVEPPIFRVIVQFK
ncbi:sensor histidine kinase [Pseudidiomarina donghaiensis]|uniref:histidine kinase n=1 Tax=Pseudidiomarina donghaiensis TaxID=519452 RepID=A0A432XH10_9GAMM|nr:sensor histidine kinase [Pseudidiomarina donghaiensis]SFV22816.1 Signal transduction histidine kinase [Pseudidiomarina donghaiensis]